MSSEAVSEIVNGYASSSSVGGASEEVRVSLGLFESVVIFGWF